MVFCYVTAVDSPRKSGRSSKGLSMRMLLPTSSLSDFMATLNEDEEKLTQKDILAAIPDHEWRLLHAISKKKEEEMERNKLSLESNEIWRRQQVERKKLEQETTQSYKRFILWKRAQEQQWQQHKRDEKRVEDLMKAGQLQNYIMRKDRRTATVLADQDDLKNKRIMDKAMDQSIRYQMASGRRDVIGAAEAHRKELDLAFDQRRLDEANRRREERLRCAAKRAAITNALTSWDSKMARQELMALEAAKVANQAAKIAMTTAKTNKILWTREKIKKRARDVAMLTSQLRESVRAGDLLF